MTPNYPSDDGSNIFPRHGHNQLDALARMFGEPAPIVGRSAASSVLAGVELRVMRVTSGPTFTPAAGTLDETRADGRLLWLPAKLPYAQRLGWHRAGNGGDRLAVYVQITHEALDGSRRPRTPASCAALRAQIGKYGNRLGGR
jgi:hypothetical protein